jgi:hypothetical protein
MLVEIRVPEDFTMDDLKNLMASVLSRVFIKMASRGLFKVSEVTDSGCVVPASIVRTAAVRAAALNGSREVTG